MNVPRAFWRRWKLTIAYVMIVAVALSVYWVNDHQNAENVKTASEAACRSVTQVRDAVGELTKPATTQGVTDANTLARIAVANAARAEAQRTLDKKLACNR